MKTNRHSRRLFLAGGILTAVSALTAAVLYFRSIIDPAQILMTAHPDYRPGDPVYQTGLHAFLKVHQLTGVFTAAAVLLFAGIVLLAAGALLRRKEEP